MVCWRNLRSDFGVKGKKIAVFIGFLAAPRRRIRFLTYTVSPQGRGTLA
jgi:hypothetical protein